METQAQLDQAIAAMRASVWAELPTQVDVFVMARNSQRFLEACLSSIEENVNVNRLILIDGNSIDDTHKIAKRHNAKILSDGGMGLGYSRKLASVLCETEWACFIDADVELPRDWHNKIMKHAGSDVGAIASIALTIPINTYEERITRIQNRNLHRKVGDLKGKTARGFTGATLIKTGLLHDLRMPPIKSEEDYVITQHILRRARWLRAPIFVRHYDRFSERPERICHTWAAARVLHRMKTIPFLLKRANVMLKSLLLALYYREPLYFMFYIKYSTNAIRGWLNWSRYINEPYPTGIKHTTKRGLSLNIGCGASKRYTFRDLGCDVNTDISIPYMKIPNYVCCDALHLPFRSVFTNAFANHLVEHLIEPKRAIEEFKTISSSVTITVPHWLSTDAYLDPTHRWVLFAGDWGRIPWILRFIVKFRFLRRVINRLSRLLELPRQKTMVIYR